MNALAFFEASVKRKCIHCKKEIFYVRNNIYITYARIGSDYTAQSSELKELKTFD